MTTADDDKRPSVMIAADAGSYSITTVSLAVQMAASTNTRLRGLFVEDEDLMQVTGLPITREIYLTSARERSTDVQQMKRALRSVARQFEQALEREASASQIAWSYDYVRGRLRDIGLKSANATYTILGQPLSRRVHGRAPRRILVIANQTSRQQQALEVVMRKYAHEAIELTIVDGGFADKEPGWLSLPRDPAVEIRLVEIPRDRLFELLARRGSLFDCVILSRHEAAEQLTKILKSLGCPVILVA
jgi:hypothetical protein